MLSRLRNSNPRVPLIAMTALVLGYIWLNLFHGALGCIGVLAFFGIGLWSHWRRGENLRQVLGGLRFFPDTPTAMFPVAVFMTLPVLAGWSFGTSHFPDLSGSTEKLLGNLLWGTFQQYGLLAFYLRGFQEFLGKNQAGWAAAGMFAVFHLPNPMLTLVTFAFGIITCRLYQRGVSLFACGALHAIGSFALSHSLPDELLLGMRVGWGAINRF